MVRGIQTYLTNTDTSAGIIAMDVQDRGYEDKTLNTLIYGIDFLKDDFTLPAKPDYIIMNPPYSIIEPFVMKALEMADKGVLMLARLQFLEGQGRYENILKNNPPTDVYIYVDRIKCYKNGDTSQTESSAQAYAWYFFNKLEMENQYNTKIHWIRRNDKLEK